MKFVLEIELGNDAMQHWTHVRKAIAGAIDPIRLSRNAANLNRPHPGDGGKIMDVNGNSVGTWEVGKDEAREPSIQWPALQTPKDAQGCYERRYIETYTAGNPEPTIHTETVIPGSIDLTPRGCTTPQGCERTSKAIDAFNASAHEVANRANDLLAARTNGTVTGYDWEEIETAVKARELAQEEFLRAVAG
jgi:hypothetical protein